MFGNKKFSVGKIVGCHKQVENSVTIRKPQLEANEYEVLCLFGLKRTYVCLQTETIQLSVVAAQKLVVARRLRTG